MRTLSRIIGAWALGISLLLIALQTSAAADRTLLAFGDSLSAAYGLRPEQGWVALLEKRLRAQDYGYTVVNASVSGETTSGGLQRLPRALDLHHPHLVILELGANDALRGLPLATSKQNLSQMIELCQKAGAGVLLVAMRIPPNYGPRYTADFAQMYTDLAHTYRLTMVPFLLQDVALDPTRMQDDGMHPNALGEPIVLNNVWPHLQPLLDKKH